MLGLLVCLKHVDDLLCLQRNLTGEFIFTLITADQFIQSSEIKLVANYFDSWLFVSGIFKIRIVQLLPVPAS